MFQNRLRPAWLTRESLRRVVQVISLAARDFFNDNGTVWAAAIAYYSLLSLFPLLLTVGSIASYFVDSQWAIYRAIEYLGEFLPRDARAIEQIVIDAFGTGRRGGILFFAALLWSGSLVFNAMIKALNIIYSVEDECSFLKRVFLRFGILLLVEAMLLAALASPFVLRLLRATLGILPAGREFVFQLIIQALPAIFVLLAFFLAYRYVPKRTPDWRAAFFGAVTATLLFAAAKPIFLGYVHEPTRYTIIYGSLTGIIIVVLWTWIVAMIGLFGAQISAHSQAILIERQPVHKVQRYHLDPRPGIRKRRIRKC